MLVWSRWAVQTACWPVAAASVLPAQNTATAQLPFWWRISLRFVYWLLHYVPCWDVLIMPSECIKSLTRQCHTLLAQSPLQTRTCRLPETSGSSSLMNGIPWRLVQEKKKGKTREKREGWLADFQGTNYSTMAMCGLLLLWLNHLAVLRADVIQGINTVNLTRCTYSSQISTTYADFRVQQDMSCTRR